MPYELLKQHGYTNYKIIQRSKLACSASAINSLGKKVFLKSIFHLCRGKFECTCTTNIPNEMKIMKILQDEEYSPQFIEFHDDGPYRTVVSEYLDESCGWYPMNIIKDYDQTKLKSQISQFANIMDKMSKLGVYYLDIKAENVMVNLNDNKVKIVDFDDAIYCEKENPSINKVVGTPGYRCPLQVYHRKYNIREAQVYGIGCLLYRCIEHKCVYDEEFDVKLKKFVPDFKLSSALNKSLIMSCVQYNVKDRIKFKSLLKQLN